MNPIQGFIQKAISSPLHFDEKEIIKKAPPAVPVYSVETGSKASRIGREIILGILSALFFPYGIYRLVHLLGGKAIVPAQVLSQVKRMDREAFGRDLKEMCTGKENALIAKRITLRVDGKKIDAMILGKAKTLNNKRWTLISNGNGMRFESLTANAQKLELIDKEKTNLLFYNYQGVGESEGCAVRDAIVNAHKAMLKFLEDEEKGVGAKEIIQWGISIGGGVQGHAMKTHKRKDGVKYVCFKEQTFSQLSKVPGPFLGKIIKFFGWELDSVDSSRRFEKEGIPEIILQNSIKEHAMTADQIQPDGVISKKSAHAYRLLSLKEKWKHKKFIKSFAPHCAIQAESTVENIHKAIEKSLSPSYQGFHAISHS